MSSSTYQRIVTMSQEDIRKAVHQSYYEKQLISYVTYKYSARTQKVVVKLHEDYFVVSELYGRKAHIIFFEEVREATPVPRDDEWMNVDDKTYEELITSAIEWYENPLILAKSREKRYVKADLEEFKRYARRSKDDKKFLELINGLTELL